MDHRVQLDVRSYECDSYGLVTERIEIDYKRPLFVGDRVTVLTHPVKFGRASGVFRQTVFRGEEEMAVAEVTWVSVDARGRPRAMPEAFAVHLKPR